MGHDHICACKISAKKVKACKVESKHVCTETLQADTGTVKDDLNVGGNLCVDGDINAKSDLNVNGDLSANKITSNAVDGNITIEAGMVIDLPTDKSLCITTQSITTLLPMEEIPVTPTPETTPFTGSVVAGPLTITHVNDQPWYFRDKEGKRVLQCGFEEANPEAYTPDDVENPIGTFDGKVEIKATDPTVIAEMKLQFRYSIEPDFDFLIVMKNGAEIASFTDFTGDASYVSAEMTVLLDLGDVITVQYLKDSSFRAGYDSIYFYIEEVSTFPFNTSKVKIGSDLCVDGKIEGNNMELKEGLVVCGKIENTELELCKYLPPPPTQAIYDQAKKSFDDRKHVNYIMEQEKEVSYPLATRLSGVYGYVGGDFSTPVIDGGEIYNPDYTSVNFKTHTPIDEEVFFATEQNIVDTLQISSDFFTARGFSMIPPDLTDFNEGHYNFSLNTDTLSTQIDIKFVYGNGPDTIPTAVDIATISSNLEGFGSYLVIGNYEDDLENNRDPLLCYPLRVPITQDIEEVATKKKNGESTVHYNPTTQQLTFNVINENFVSCFDPDRPSTLSQPDLEAPTPITSAPLTVTMKDFFGTFQLAARSRKNDIIPSTFEEVNYFIQVSPTVQVNCTTEWLDIYDPNTSFMYQRTDDSGKYIGAILVPSGRETSAIDVFVFNTNTNNAFADTVPPYVAREQGFPSGDNPNTAIREYNAITSGFAFFDDISWKDTDRLYTESFIDSPPIPENFASFPPSLQAPGNILFSLTTGHELVHNHQFAGPQYSAMDGEGQAVGIETDIKINKGVMFNGRHGSYTSFITNSARGNLAGLANEAAYGASYGTGMFWNWLYKTHDPLHQVLRRTWDLMSSVGQKIITDYITEYPLADQRFHYSALYKLFLDQALNELHGLNYSDVHRDFIISMSLIRNNTSISNVNPAYTSKHPFWVAQSGYTDNALAADLPTWWEEFDNNLPSAGASTFAEAIVTVGGVDYMAGSTLSAPISTYPIVPITFPGELTVPAGACSEPVADLTGKIGIIDFDECGPSFSGDRVLRVEAANCEGTLIISDTDDNIDNFGGSALQTKACFVVSQSDGDAIKAYLLSNPGADVTMVTTSPKILPQLELGHNETTMWEDLSSFIYVVDSDNVSSVTVTCGLGELSATMHEYESANVPNDPGTFTILDGGPIALSATGTSVHIFDVTALPRNGLIRLAITNTAITDFSNGGADPINNLIIDESIDRNTGSVTIVTA